MTQLPYNRLFDEQNWLAFSPRLGAAWRPFAQLEHVVVRGGYGIFHSAVAGTAAEQAFFDPWYIFVSGGGTAASNARFQSPFPPIPSAEQFPIYLPYRFRRRGPSSVSMRRWSGPYTQQWSANVQGQWGNG